MSGNVKLGLFTPCDFVYDGNSKVWAHKRIKNNSFNLRDGICFLCRRRGELTHSHIVSKAFINRGSKDIAAVGDNASGLIANKHIQDGQKFYMFCSSCEEQSSRHERVTSSFLNELYNLNLPYSFTSEEAHSIILAILGMSVRQFYAESNFLSNAKKPAWGRDTLNLVEKSLINDDSYRFSLGGHRIALPDKFSTKRNLISVYPRLQNSSRTYRNIISCLIFGEVFWQISADKGALRNMITSEVDPMIPVNYLLTNSTLRWL